MSESTDTDQEVESQADEHEEIVKLARERYKESRTAAAEWRKEARRCFDFRAGNQWSDEDKAALLENMRMPVTFNRIDPYCRAVAGLEAGNRQEVRYIPREMGDVGVNELYTEAVRWMRTQCDAEYEDADAFIDAFISGVGCTETYMDYEDDPEGMAKVDHLDCINEVVWDSNAKKRNLTDRRYDFRIKRHLSYDDLAEMFPDAIDKISSKEDWDHTDDDDAEPWDRNPETAYKKDSEGETTQKKKYSLLDYQWCEKESYYKVADPLSGQVTEMEADKFEKLNANMKKMGIELQAAKMKRKVWYRAFIVGGEVMETGPAPCKKSSARKFITGYRDRNKKCFYGMVRAMIDPQEWANKFFSQMLQIINTTSKGGLIAESDAFANPRKAEEQWADPSSVVLLKPGGLAKVREREVAAFPASIDSMMKFSIGALSDVTGIPLEMIGMVDRDQAGVLETERKKTGVTMLAQLFDSFKHYRKDQGVLFLYYIKEYMSDGRLIRITGESGQKYVPLVRQDDTIEFDIIVDEMPQSPNNKEMVWSALQSMLPMLMKAGMPPEMLAEFIKYSPLPETFYDKMKQIMDQKSQQGPNPMQQAELAKTQADTEKTAADTKLSQAKVGLTDSQSAAALVTAHIDAANANAMADQMMGIQPQGMPQGQPMPPQPMQQPPQAPPQF